MSDDRLVQAVSRQDAVQPSLWDRLVDDLPGLSAEATALGRDLGRALGSPEAAEALVASGARGIEARDDLPDATRLVAHRLIRLRARQRALGDDGIVVTAQALREAVRRDIEMLFNTERFEADILLSDHQAQGVRSPRALLADYPQVRRSVLNYGVPSFSGQGVSDIDPETLGQEIKAVLGVFEPRLDPRSLKVRVSRSDTAGLMIEVDGTLMLSPVPERLRLSTTVDLDNGNASTTLEDR